MKYGKICLCLLLAVVLLLGIYAGRTLAIQKQIQDASLDDQTEAAEKAAFSYEHDPRENPTAMRDVVEDHDAVHGFYPSPAE